MWNTVAIYYVKFPPNNVFLHQRWHVQYIGSVARVGKNKDKNDYQLPLSNAMFLFVAICLYMASQREN